MAKNGRPQGGSVYSPDINEILLKARKLADTGFFMPAIAEFLGVSTRTVQTWKKERPEFADTIQQLRDRVVARGIKSLVKTAEGYWVRDDKPFVIENQIRVAKVKKFITACPKAQQYLLSNLDPENWKNRSKDDADSGGEPLTPVSINIVARSARRGPPAAGGESAQGVES